MNVNVACWRKKMLMLRTKNHTKKNRKNLTHAELYKNLDLKASLFLLPILCFIVRFSDSWQSFPTVERLLCKSSEAVDPPILEMTGESLRFKLWLPSLELTFLTPLLELDPPELPLKLSKNPNWLRLQGNFQELSTLHCEWSCRVEMEHPVRHAEGLICVVSNWLQDCKS